MKKYLNTELSQLSKYLSDTYGYSLRDFKICHQSFEISENIWCFSGEAVTIIDKGGSHLLIENGESLVDDNHPVSELASSNPYQDSCPKCGESWLLHDFGVPLPYCP